MMSSVGRSTAKIIWIAAVTLATFAFSQFCLAQSAAPSKSEKAKKQTSIDFEDELIQGEVKKPELFYLLQKKQFNFKRLIKLREDFLPEMRRTSEDIRRGGGGS